MTTQRATIQISSPAPQHIEQLCLAVMNSWLQDYQALFDVLNSEQAALEKRDFNTLKQVIADKNAIIKKINGQKFPPFIDHKGLQITSLSGLKNYCQNHPSLSQNWSNLMQLVEKCCLKNEVNARLIELISASSRRVFNIIRGIDPDNNLYNSQGDRTTVRHFSNSISA
ncbi:flagella synthesis protein FlgN [Aliikangiella maris]|uniref:Flagellar protein FlgN n=2 Tax=Aliikangiella maris TaxID=3162458 RepID=A0ABV3MUK8_9GAMM